MNNTYSNGKTKCLPGHEQCVSLNNITGECLRCKAGHGLVDGTCMACAVGTSYSDGTMPCTSKCPSFSDDEETCRAAGFCMWNDKYKVCYSEREQTFTQIVVSDEANMTHVVEAMEKEYGKVVVIVDEKNRTVVIVEGDVELEEAQRHIGDFVLETEDVVAGAVEGGELSSDEEGIKKGVFVAGTVCGGIAILALLAAIVTMSMNMKKPMM